MSKGNVTTVASLFFPPEWSDELRKELGSFANREEGKMRATRNCRDHRVKKQNCFN